MSRLLFIPVFLQQIFIHAETLQLPAARFNSWQIEKRKSDGAKEATLLFDFASGLLPTS